MDVSVETVTRTFAELMVAVPHANPETTWLTQAPGAFGMVTGVPFPTLNGVWALGATDPGTVTALLDQLPTDGLPYCLQASEASRPAMTRVAEGRGMTAGPDIPVMVLSSQPEPATIAGLHMREVTGAQRQLRNEVAAAGFEVPPEAIALATDLFGRVPGYRMYVGEVEGRPVTTAVSIMATGASASSTSPPRPSTEATGTVPRSPPTPSPRGSRLGPIGRGCSRARRGTGCTSGSVSGRLRRGVCG